MIGVNVINIRNKNHSSNEYVYCGRGSALGNKYHITRDAPREIVIELYKEWFYKNLNTHPVSNQLKIIFQKIKEDGFVNLGCYCAPLQCHCDVIRDYILVQYKENDHK